MRLALKVIGLLLFILFAGSHTSAGENVDIKVGRLGSNPPFTVGGWRYQLINNRTHMFLCANSSCEPGSKISYMVLPPRKDYSFKQYKEEREKIAQVLLKMAPAGTHIEFSEPEKVEDKLFRIFKAKREQVSPDGKKTAFLSWLVMANKVSFDFISSASSFKQAEEQLAPFMLAGMMVAVTDK